MDATDPGSKGPLVRINVYKRGQGTAIRIVVMAFLALLAASGGRWLYLLPKTGTAWYQSVVVTGGALASLALVAAATVGLYRSLVRNRTDRELLRWGAMTGGVLLASVVAWWINARLFSGVEMLVLPLIATPLPVSWGVVISTLAALYAIGCVFALLVNHPQRAEFLIETETEMRKVAWPTRREYVGSSIVVIVIVAFVSIYLTLVDLVLNKLLSWLRIGY